MSELTQQNNGKPVPPVVCSLEIFYVVNVVINDNERSLELISIARSSETNQTMAENSEFYHC